MAFIQLEDLYDTIEVIIFPTVYSKYSLFLEPDTTVIIKGRISLREDEEPKVICEQVEAFERSNINKQEIKHVKSKLYLKITKDKSNAIVTEISNVLKKYKGDIPVYLYYEPTNKKFLADNSLWVRNDKDLIFELSKILGETCVKMVSS